MKNLNLTWNDFHNWYYKTIQKDFLIRIIHYYYIVIKFLVTNEADTLNGLATEHFELLRVRVGDDVFKAGQQAVIVHYEVVLHCVRDRCDRRHDLLQNKLCAALYQLQ